MDTSCPQFPDFYGPILAIVSNPTLEELRTNQDKPGIRKYVNWVLTKDDE